MLFTAHFSGLFSATVQAQRAAVPPASPVVAIRFPTLKTIKTDSFYTGKVIGLAVDGLEIGETERVYSTKNIEAIRSAGLGPLVYRVRTELAGEAWHWNPAGTWSEGEAKQGYWTSDSKPGDPIQQCYGYRLPRRGNTIDQANNDGYSRLLDDDDATFWKSNPYLDSHFTGESNEKHPQWIAIDMGRSVALDTLEIHWADPYAASFRVEYCSYNSDDGLFDSHDGIWHPFPHGAALHSRGGNQFVHLSDRPIQTRFLRILLLSSSLTRLHPGQDIRDAVGFAVREIKAGVHRADGGLSDLLRHGRSARQQSTVWVSSTDPWHRESDIDVRTEQPGIDRIYHCGLTNGLPAMMPVAPLYDTPENGAALVKYLVERKYPVTQIEIGEEPDGQNVSPEDFAALYMEMAIAVKHVAPRVITGGPSLQTSTQGYETWPDSLGVSAWNNRFISYLKRRGALRALGFFSFEWYPFDDVHVAPKPQAARRMLEHTVAELKTDGIPADIPWIITEYGYSSFASEAEVDLPGALVNADTVADFLAIGGSTSYFYGAEPTSLITELDAPGHGSATWGNLALFLSSDSEDLIPLPAFYVARMLTHDWLQTAHNTRAKVVKGKSDCVDSSGAELVSGYLLNEGEHRSSILLLNMDSKRDVKVNLELDGFNTRGGNMQIAETQYGPEQYRWHAQGAKGYAQPNSPPVVKRIKGIKGLVLPHYSVTILTIK